MQSKALALALSTIPAFALTVAPTSNAAEHCCATTKKLAQGPHPIPKGARRIIVDNNPSNGEVGVYRMGPYRISDFSLFSAGRKKLGIY